MNDDRTFVSNSRDISFNFWEFLKLIILLSEGLKSFFLLVLQTMVNKDGKHSKSPIAKSRIPHVEFPLFLLLDVWIRPFRKFPHLDFCGKSTLSNIYVWVFILVTYKTVIKIAFSRYCTCFIACHLHFLCTFDMLSSFASSEYDLKGLNEKSHAFEV